MQPKVSAWICVICTGLWVSSTTAINIDLVTVGNPDNARDQRYTLRGISSFGAVDYAYQMGRFDVTAGQYCAFLNAVARTDTHGLYHTYMDYDMYPALFGCNIKRTGSSGGYSYSVASDWANRPVNFVSWGSAARFANWLTNGQPTGEQNLATTEDGSYYLDGATSESALQAVTRKEDARYVIPTEDEWYKAAYYDPGKPGGAGYWDYPTRSNTTPSNVLDPTGTNNANFATSAADTPSDRTYTIGAPYYRTEIGAFAHSPGAYGTFDQGGNVWQWTEAVWAAPSGPCRVLRGGSFWDGERSLKASLCAGGSPASAGGLCGFRVACVPEPATLTLLSMAGLAMAGRRQRSS